MKLPRRHKSALIALGVYWPFIFWLTHIPVPDLARQSGMSDKAMHVMAYAVLTFLIWFAISPYHKVRWNRPGAWIVLIAVVLYGLIDEVLQGRVGRSADVKDFAANLFGVTLALGVLSILSFWPALLTVSGIFIFVISNLSKLLTLPQYHTLSSVFHLTAYAAITLIWIQYTERRSEWNVPRSRWLVHVCVLPLGLLFIVKMAAFLIGRRMEWIEIPAALLGIGLTVLTSWWMLLGNHKKKVAKPD